MVNLNLVVTISYIIFGVYRDVLEEKSFFTLVEHVVGGVSHFCRSLPAQDWYGWGTHAFLDIRFLFHADASNLFPKLVAIRFGDELALRCHWPRRTASIVNPKHSMWTVWLRFVVSTRGQSFRHCDGQNFSESSGLFTWLRVRVCPTSCSCIRYEFDSLVEYRVWLGTRRSLSSRRKVAVLGTLVAMKSVPFGSKEVGPTSSDISWEHVYCLCVGVESLLQDGGLYSPIPGFRTVLCEKTLVSCLWHFDCFISRERRVQAFRRCIVFYLVLTFSFFSLITGPAPTLFVSCALLHNATRSARVGASTDRWLCVRRMVVVTCREWCLTYRLQFEVGLLWSDTECFQTTRWG